MGTPLHGDALLDYVRARLEELEQAEWDLPGITAADRESAAFQVGRNQGLQSAYHDIEHVARGWYGGPDWTTENDDQEEQRRSQA